MQLKDVNLTKEQIVEYTEKYMIETYPRMPFVAVKAKDMYIYDSEGNAYLDFYGGIAVNNAGNCNEKVVATLQAQVGQIMHTFNYPYSIPQAVLSKLLVEQTGQGKLTKCFYQSSGSEANEAAIKLARKWSTDKYGPNRFYGLTALKGFHGRTYGAASATGQPESVIQVGFKPMLEGFKYIEYNNLKAWEDAIDENTAFIMVEPVQGEGGVRPGTQEFIQGLRDLADKHDLALIFDEVQTGAGRTGTFWAWQGFGVAPDIMSFAKGTGGGVPFGGILANDDKAAAFGPGAHGTTYGGSIMCCAAALAQCQEIIDRKLPANAEKVGAYFRDKLATLPHIKEVRGKGLLVGAEFDFPGAAAIKKIGIANKLLTTAIGTSIIRMVPPLIVTEADCDKAFDILKAAVEEAYKQTK